MFAVGWLLFGVSGLLLFLVFMWLFLVLLP